MKKLFIMAIIALFSANLFVSCDNDDLIKENYETTGTDIDKNCPPSDTNCNGIPDIDE